MGLRGIITDLFEGASDTEIRGAIRDALRAKYPRAYPYVEDVYQQEGWVIVRFESDLAGSNVYYRCDFTLEAEGKVATITSEPVMVVPQMQYVPIEPVDDDSEVVEEREISDEERKKIPASDFAGKNKSFPIVVPADVAAAAASMGRAGDDNYSPDQLKRRIISIAKRKGAAFVKRLPKKWRDEIGESVGFELYTPSEEDLTSLIALMEADGFTVDVEEAKQKGNVAALLRTFGDWAGGEHPHATCVSKLKGKVSNPDALCAWMKDRHLGTTKWRGSPKESGTDSNTLDVTTDTIDLVEAAVNQDGTVEVKLIQPGWGSSGYYPAEVLKRDGPKVFRSGTHMYWNHATEAEDQSRPEGDLTKLASVLVTDAYYKEAHKRGPGLYAKAKVFGDYKQAVEDRAPYIGLSIRGKATPMLGEAEGKTGTIIAELLHGRSVDYVTRPGAGGAILQLNESARVESARTSDASSTVGVSTDMVDQAEFDAMKESVAKLVAANEAKDKLIESLNKDADDNKLFRLMTEAATIVRGTVSDSKDIPDVVKPKLIATLTKNPPVTEAGVLDREALGTQITEAIKERAEEINAIIKVAVPDAPVIYGVGAASVNESAPQQTMDEVTKELTESFIRMGMSKEQAAIAVAGR